MTAASATLTFKGSDDRETLLGGNLIVGQENDLVGRKCCFNRDVFHIDKGSHV